MAELSLYLIWLQPSPFSNPEDLGVFLPPADGALGAHNFDLEIVLMTTAIWGDDHIPFNAPVKSKKGSGPVFGVHRDGLAGLVGSIRCG